MFNTNYKKMVPSFYKITVSILLFASPFQVFAELSTLDENQPEEKQTPIENQKPAEAPAKNAELKLKSFKLKVIFCNLSN